MDRAFDCDRDNMEASRGQEGRKDLVKVGKLDSGTELGTKYGRSAGPFSASMGSVTWHTPITININYVWWSAFFKWNML